MFLRRNKEGQTFNKWYLILLLIFIAIGVGLKLYGLRWPTAKVVFGDKQIEVLVADTARHRYAGLGNRSDPGEYDGMLFVFPSVGSHGIVMRDMQFSIDIVWLNDGKVVDIAPNVPTEPGIAEKDLMVYWPRVPAALVLELPAGYAMENDLKIGDQVEVLD
ncbi:MAG TPA: DUF192 domain-containing protein [Patescibacteria group bacterium]|nr:DUF192 domain-containing protein [Patescibacteria group bacterium]